jgi:hypothetical protein
MLSYSDLRELALSLPGSVERDHHGRPSFRVENRIFATLWDAGHANVMLDEAGIHTALEREPRACAEFWWGRRLRAVQVDLATVTRAVLADLLADAWERKAPARLRNARPRAPETS